MSARTAARRQGLRVPRRALPRQQQPDLIRGHYSIELKYALAPMKRITEATLFPLLPRLLEQVQRNDGVRHDVGEVSRGRAAVEAAQSHFMSNFRNLTPLAQGVGRATSDFERAQLSRQLRAAVGVEVPIKDKSLGPRLERFTEQNVSLIKSIPSRYFAQVEKLVIDGVSEGRRWESLASDIQERFDVAESSANLIARDQVGKFFGELARVRQTELGIRGYIWRTMHDEKVRPEHAALDGDSFLWSQGDPEEGHPGEAINCRCFADPDLEAVLGSIEGRSEDEQTPTDTTPEEATAVEPDEPVDEPKPKGGVTIADIISTMREHLMEDSSPGGFAQGTTKEIAEVLGVSPGTALKALQRAADEGVVTRRGHEQSVKSGKVGEEKKGFGFQIWELPNTHGQK